MFVDSNLVLEESIILPKTTSHHLCTVLRLQAEDEVTLFNGDGNNYTARITAAGKTARVDITAVSKNEGESPLQLELIQGISRGDRMDTTLQKAVELGVKKIYPVLTDKSAVRLSGDRLEKKVQHWKAIVISACEQSGRSYIPALTEPLTLPDWLNNHCSASPSTLEGSHWLFVPGASIGIGALQAPAEPCRVLIGPESGLSDNEIEQCIEVGFKTVSLGQRILRTETAGPAVIAILQSRFGDLR